MILVRKRLGRDLIQGDVYTANIFNGKRVGYDWYRCRIKCRPVGTGGNACSKLRGKLIGKPGRGEGVGRCEGAVNRFYGNTVVYIRKKE